MTLYDRQVTGNLRKEQQTLELWAQTYPRDSLSHGLLSGLATQGTGEYERGIEEAEKCIALDPDEVYAYDSLTWHNLHLGRWEDADKAVQRAMQRKLDNPDFLFARFQLAFLRGDQAGMDRETNLARGKPGVEDMNAHHRALVLARSGHMQQARILWEQAAALAGRSPAHSSPRAQA